MVDVHFCEITLEDLMSQDPDFADSVLPAAGIWRMNQWMKHFFPALCLYGFQIKWKHF